MSFSLEQVLTDLDARLWSVLAGKVRARLELELAVIQFELREQAASWRQDYGEFGESIARRLETASEHLAAELARLGSSTPGGLGTSGVTAPQSGDETALLSSKRSRGRPKKFPSDDNTPGVPSPAMGITETKAESTP